MTDTCQSEYGKIRSVFIKQASDAFVDDELIDRDWEKLNFLSRPDLSTANLEYAKFESVLRDHGAEISFLPKDDSVAIDSIYCRDASIATDHGMIICNMGKAARAPEP